jgi:hypothetical protein
VVGQDGHGEKEEGESGVNPRPPQAVFAYWLEEELFSSVHVVVLPSIRSES